MGREGALANAIKESRQHISDKSEGWGQNGVKGRVDGRERGEGHSPGQGEEVTHLRGSIGLGMGYRDRMVVVFMVTFTHNHVNFLAGRSLGEESICDQEWQSP